MRIILVDEVTRVTSVYKTTYCTILKSEILKAPNFIKHTYRNYLHFELFIHSDLFYVPFRNL